MIYNMYSIRDSRTGFLSPTCDINDVSAERNFEHACFNRSSLFYTHVKDYDLVKIGQYDSDTGELLPCDHKVLLTGAQVELRMKFNNNETHESEV